NMQGRDRTFYVGGVTDFELVEPIVVHSKYIVERHFIGGGEDKENKFENEKVSEISEQFILRERARLMEI
ncbi:MAG TPA: hypothetical protein VLB84_17515, partial [Bacteroidia bacterium]|nr:hypothetical protein [Bacteroidia bacterium]